MAAVIVLEMLVGGRVAGALMERVLGAERHPAVSPLFCEGLLLAGPCAP